MSNGKGKMIRRRGQRIEYEESSSDEEDAFAALSKKSKPKKINVSVANQTKDRNGDRTQHDTSVPIPKEKDSIDVSNSKSIMKLPISKTSSKKRHHKPNDARKASMDALIQELEEDNMNQIPKKLGKGGFIPQKKGSFVDPTEEHLTTNLFVGNLAPSITEEGLSNLFSQFGEETLCYVVS